jgi:hypothetical protein
MHGNARIVPVIVTMPGDMSVALNDKNSLAPFGEFPGCYRSGEPRSYDNDIEFHNHLDME